jgi:uncharacterized membrane protein
MSTTQSAVQPRIRSEQFERPARQADRINVGDTERWLCLLGGGALTVFGLSRESLPGLALAAAGGALAYRGFTGHCPVYGALDINTAQRGPATVIPARHGVKVEEAMTINRPAHDLYQFWRDFERLPHFMRHLESVHNSGGNRSHWVAKGPMGMHVEWDAEIYTEKPDEMIAWRSLEGADVDNTGSIHFRPAPAGRGTEMHVVLKYDPPAGKAGALIAKLFGKDPEGLIREDLYRFKQLMEAGEIATVEGQTSCRTH